MTGPDMEIKGDLMPLGTQQQPRRCHFVILTQITLEPDCLVSNITSAMNCVTLGKFLNLSVPQFFHL